MKKETLQNIVLSVASTVIALGVFAFVLESGLSADYDQWKSDYAKNGDWFGKLVRPSDNPILMWEYTPNAESNVTDFALIRTNRHGFRDKDSIEKKKPSDVYRVSFIGDSTTLGYNVEGSEVYTERLEAHAKETYPSMNLQALNHGVDGYNTPQITEMLKSKVLAFHPDKVVYTLCLNDFDFEDSSGDKVLYFQKPFSFLYKKAENVYREVMGIEFHQWHFRKNKTAVFEEIAKMKNILKEKGIFFQVVILPTFHFFDSEDYFMGPEHFSEYDGDNIHNKIHEFLDKEKIAYYDLLGDFKETGKGPADFAQDIWHPTAAGLDFMAKKMLKPVLGGYINEAKK